MPEQFPFRLLKLSPVLLLLAASPTGPVPSNAPHVADLPAPGTKADEVREQPVRTEPWGPEVFRERRANLMAQMKSGVALILASKHIDYDAGARQSPDFLYLTGLAEETNGALVLAPQEPRKEFLFLAPAVPERDRWSGYRALLPSRDVEVRTGFATIYRMDPFGSRGFGGLLSTFAARWKDLHYFGPVVGYDADLPLVLDAYAKTAARVPGAKTKDSIGMLARLRMVKEPREIEKIARASDISIAGHVEAMRRVKPGMREWELKQILEDSFRKGGARRLAYPSIVGSGPDGCVLHYPDDDRVIRDGDLILIDAGAEFDHYATDITRTFPANGKFSPEQRHIYEVVLHAQNAALALVKPGVTWEQLNDAAAKVIAEAGYYDYFIHSVGHHVGLEVHDVPSPIREIPEGSVITLEPGIYMPGKKIGVRIEDILVVTKRGARVLSEKLPRDPDEIEKVMAAAKR